jgi:predicted dehydrogenase
MSVPLTRRAFQRTSAAAIGLTALQASQVLGANERIRVGFIGVGNRGMQVLEGFLRHEDCEVAAICDVFTPYLDRAKERLGGKPTTDRDFRKLLERRDIDAVVVATPDHWHAIQTIDACDAGKDAYVEKPLSITVVEGRKMVEAARRNRRVVQVGTHRRSSGLYTRLAASLAAGDIGKITVSRAYRASNMYPLGIGKAETCAPPAELDWDMWLGPRPEQPFQVNIAPYKFRWWDLYSSQMANWGVHYLDAIRWLTGETAPSSVCAMGGRFAIDDDRTVPDTLEATFEFASGRLAVFGQYEASGNPVLVQGELELRGTLATAYIDDKGYEFVPERGGQFQERAPRIEPVKVAEKERHEDMTAAHARNFLDCVKSRKTPRADIEIGHRSTTMSLLANISLAVRQRLDWDAEKERITNHEAANALLHYEYRKPWKLG